MQVSQIVVCPSGVVVRFSAQKVPATQVLRATLNSLAGKQVFHVKEDEPQPPTHTRHETKPVSHPVNEVRGYDCFCERISFQVPDDAKRWTRTRGGSPRNAGRKARYAH